MNSKHFPSSRTEIKKSVWIPTVIAAICAAAYVGSTGSGSHEDASPNPVNAVHTSNRVDSPRAGASFLPLRETRSSASSAPIAASAHMQTAGKQIEELSKSTVPSDRFKAYSLAYKCSVAKMFQEQVDHTFQAERSDTHPELEQYIGACDGVSQQMLSYRYENLKVAVAAKVPGAVHQSFVEGPFGDNDALSQRPDDPLVIEWKEQTIAALKAAAEAGDRASILDLMQIYENGAMTSPDPVQALTYRLIEGKIAAQAGRPHRTSSSSSPTSSLSKSEVDAANLTATSIFDSCCNAHK